MNYYNPYQNYNQSYNPYQNQLQQQAQNIRSGSLVSVSSEEEARMYPVGPGNSVTFKNENMPYIYTKTMGFSQLDRPTSPISVALAIDGEPLLTSRAIVTPAAVDEYFNVTSTAFIDVPKGCCFTIAVENTSTSATPGTTPAPAINVQNANLVVVRTA